MEKTEVQKAIEHIEKETCFKMTTMTDKESAFFVPVAADGKTVIGPCFEMSRSTILKLAAVVKPQGVK